LEEPKQKYEADYKNVYNGRRSLGFLGRREILFGHDSSLRRLDDKSLYHESTRVGCVMGYPIFGGFKRYQPLRRPFF
jgi:hypothetical protein